LTSSYDGRYIQTGSFNSYTSSFSSSLASSITSVSGTFTNLTVNGQPTTYGVVNGSYLLAQNNAEQTGVGNGTAISFQTTSASNGSLITKGSNTQVTLTAGNTYKLEAIIRRFTSTSTWGAFRWYDVTNSTYVGIEAFGEVVNSTTAIGSTLVATHYVTPSVNTTYELRQTTVNTITVSSAYASIEITQINPTIAVQSTATGTMNGTVGNVTLSNSYTQVVAASSPGTTIFTLPTLQPGTYLITARAKVNGLYSVMGIFTGGSQVANTSVFNWYQGSGTAVNNGLQGTWVLTVTTPTVYTINAWGGGTVQAGSDGSAVANYIQLNPTFALTAISGLTTTSDVNVGGNLNVTGTGGNVLTKTTGTWTLPTGASTQSFTVESGHSYSMWVNGNIPNGIITWNATVTTSNSNVPAVGSQYGWYYTPGNALVLTAMPGQIIGTHGSILNTPTSYAPNTSNVFSFGITNNSGTSQTISYGYIKLS